MGLRVFICSPFRGADGSPSEINKQLARVLMRAVFDAGHFPFAPHLLYPQVLTEHGDDIARAFAANTSFLGSCDQLWAWASTPNDYTSGMKVEIDRAWRIAVPVRLMPAPFSKLFLEGWRAETATHTGHIPGRGPIHPPRASPAPWVGHLPSGHCVRCQNETLLNRAGWCAICFAQGSAT